MGWIAWSKGIFWNGFS